MLSEKVARLRQLMSEAVPVNQETPLEAAAKRQFQLHQFNAEPALIVEQTQRARNEREINRIGSWYGWNSEIVRALDRDGAASLSGLGDAAIDRLLQRMRQLEQCAQDGLDPPDAAPAR